MASRGRVSAVLLAVLALFPVAVSGEQVAQVPPAGRAQWIETATRYVDEHRVAQLLGLVEATRAAYPAGEREAECQRYTAEALLIKGQHEQAIAQFQSVTASFPGSDQAAFAQYGIGEAYRVRNKLEDALAAYERVLKGYPGAEACSWVGLRKGNILALQGRKDDAIAHWRQVTLAYPRTQPAARSQAYIAHTLLDQGKKAEAVVEYERLLAEYEGVARRVELARAHETIARIAAEQGDYDTAFQHRRGVLEEFPDCRTAFDSYYEMARMAKARGTLDNFISELENDVRTANSKRRPAAMMVLQRLYLDAGLAEKAAPLREALKGELADQSDAGDLAHGVFYLARRLMMEEGESPEALKLYQDGLLLDITRTKEVSFRSDFAYCLRKMGEYEKAVEQYRAIIAGYEDLPNCRAAAHYDIAFTYWMAKDYRKASAEAQVILTSYPQSSWVKPASELIGRLNNVITGQ